MEPKGGAKSKEKELDPADYLLQTTKYHDRNITVGDPDTDQVETFGVSTLHLVSHSTVFREMFVESELADRTGKNTHITDVTPEVFKLMLRHVYGGQLPEMCLETAAQLALCADKYNIQPLVKIAAAKLVPTTVQEVFPALRLVVYINNQDLEKHVAKIVQEQTDKVVAHEAFLTLDGNCLKYIAKQKQLAVSELELWKGLVNWVKHKTNGPAEMRKLLLRPLRHVRLLTLTQDDIIKEVLPSGILTSEEKVNLLLAKSNQIALKSSILCSTKQERPRTTSNENYTISLGDDMWIWNGVHSSSRITITSCEKEIEILSFTCKIRPTLNARSNYRCDISIHQRNEYNDFSPNTDFIEINTLVTADKNVILPIKLKSGSYVKIKPHCSCLFELSFSSYQPAYKTNNNYLHFKQDNIKVQIERICHVLKIEYNF